MGHKVAIHNAAYRLHTSAIEITKVGRLLAALDRGDITRQQGRTLNSLGIDSKYYFDILTAYLTVLWNYEANELLHAQSDNHSGLFGRLIQRSKGS